MPERLFFALWPGEEQRLALTRVQRECSPHHGRATHPEDLHLTLVFLGALEPERRACSESVGDRVRGSPFTLGLTHIGYFARARALWCGPEAMPQPLPDLVDGLGRGLIDCGLLPESRPYSPHVTLARKLPPPQGLRPLAPSISWRVEEFVLAGGRGGGPARYRVLRRWPLV